MLVMSRTAAEKNIKHIKCKIIKHRKPLIILDFNSVIKLAKSKRVES